MRTQGRPTPPALCVTSGGCRGEGFYFLERGEGKASCVCESLFHHRPQCVFIRRPRLRRANLPPRVVCANIHTHTHEISLYIFITNCVCVSFIVNVFGERWIICSFCKFICFCLFFFIAHTSQLWAVVCCGWVSFVLFLMATLHSECFKFLRHSGGRQYLVYYIIHCQKLLCLCHAFVCVRDLLPVRSVCAVSTTRERTRVSVSVTVRSPLK